MYYALVDMRSDCIAMTTLAWGDLKGVAARLIEECELKPKTVGLIINRAPKGELNDGIREEIELQGLKLLGVVPQDDGVYECDCAGKPTSQLPADSPVKKALYEILNNLNL